MTVPEYRITIDRTPRVAETLPVDPMRGSSQVAGVVRGLIDDDEREHFIVLFCDARNRIKGVSEISVGSLTSSLVHPREAFRAAVGIGASAVIFAHNHPSGDPAPSREDRALTRRLVDAGRILGIRVLDHVVIGDGTGANYSFADHGEMGEQA